MKDITIGQFFPGNSPIHRCDPRVKLILEIALIVVLFLAKGIVSYALLAFYLATVIKLSGIPFKMVTRGLKPVVFIVAFTAVLNIFYTPAETYLWEW